MLQKPERKKNQKNQAIDCLSCDWMREAVPIPATGCARFHGESGLVESYTVRLDSISLSEFKERFKIVIEPVTATQAKIARQAYRDFGKGSGHPAGLNFGDCFTYALASEKREPVLWKGDDFGHTDLRGA
jgi:hypothetical protein